MVINGKKLSVWMLTLWNRDQWRCIIYPHNWLSVRRSEGFVGITVLGCSVLVWTSPS